MGRAEVQQIFTACLTHIDKGARRGLLHVPYGGPNFKQVCCRNYQGLFFPLGLDVRNNRQWVRFGDPLFCPAETYSKSPPLIIRAVTSNRR